MKATKQTTTPESGHMYKIILDTPWVRFRSEPIDIVEATEALLELEEEGYECSLEGVNL